MFTFQPLKAEVRLTDKPPRPRAPVVGTASNRKKPAEIVSASSASHVRATIVPRFLDKASLVPKPAPNAQHAIVTAGLLACIGPLPDVLCGHPQPLPTARFSRRGADGNNAAVRIDNVLAFTSTRHHDELIACVSFTNQAPVGATAVSFHFDAENAAGDIIKSFTRDVDGNFAPGVSIQAPTFPGDSLMRALKYCWWTKRPDEALSTAVRIVAYVDHVTFADGVLWDTHGMPLP